MHKAKAVKQYLNQTAMQHTFSNTMVTFDDQPPQKINETCPLSRCSKLVLLALLLLSLVMAALAYGLTVYLQPKVVVVNKSQTEMPDGSIFGFASLQLEDNNIFEPDLSFNLYVTYPIETREGRRLQEGLSKACIHYYDKDTGITIKLNLQGNSSYFVNTKVFADFVNKKLSEDKSNQDNQRIKVDDRGFLSDLGQIFTSSLAKSTGIKDSEVKFQIIEMVSLKISSAKGIQYDTSQKNEIRKLLESKLRNLSAVAKDSVLKSIMAKIAGFFINTIRKFGPQIGKVVGLFVAIKNGNFSNTVTIMKAGEKIGSAAASLVNGCIPQGEMRISCPPNLIGNILAQFGGEAALVGALGELFANFKGPVNVKNIKEFLKTIPSSALTNFAFGLPVTTIQEK